MNSTTQTPSASSRNAPTAQKHAAAIKPLPNHRDHETPDEVYNHFLQWMQRAGTKPERAHIFAQDRATSHRKKMLGHFDHLTESAAHFMAAMLRQKRMPAGAQRWVAQQCLEAWLPHMRQAEQAEVVATLRKCSPEQLGPDLVSMIAQAPAAD